MLKAPTSADVGLLCIESLTSLKMQTFKASLEVEKAPQMPPSKAIAGVGLY